MPGTDAVEPSSDLINRRATAPAAIMASMATMARNLRGARTSLDETLDTVAKSAIELIPGADHACITVIAGRDRTVMATTDDVATDLCRYQFELGEGPTEREIWQIDTVVADDLSDEQRWPSFADSARARGVQSMAAFQLFADAGNRSLGVLLVFSDQVGAFDPDALGVGSALASHAAIAVLGARDEQHFRTGLASRDIIGQAKGMLMERFSIDAVEAFTLITTLSQQENRPLRDIAQALVDAEHPVRSVT
ncbi:GAF and ANTAR domain-containing protein [Rhodococcus sp. G-MC3]|uniref:GAF and ANTAR domain-containing protein n=1 Tax=Rhodococcus sp. G-MC3 TaxID=3046209 RepID=UPI0024B9A9D8|nr:GAF and ANTAR domain-containing protein [Rhodococcus sp. G-MC3]MDJ0392909.1 GAF and ANTAR domain-containing protein [Rhodococcus sp. G-MC3]